MAVDVLLPCLDEAAALPWILERMPTGYHALLIDNGSTDGSGEVARQHGAAVVEAVARGYGAACHQGLLCSTSEVICVMDADGSLDPQDLPRLAAPVLTGMADLAVGRRRPTNRAAWPVHARVGNAVLTQTLRRRGITGLHDIGPMRAARRDQLLALRLLDRRYGYPLEQIVRTAAAGMVIVECDVSYRPRIGRSKVTGTVRGTLRTVRDMRRVLAT
jgi:glycosyltransferase involved in cell wall biosynthesis